MPPQVIFGFIIESALVMITVLLLARPIPARAGESNARSLKMTVVGLFFLAITFCWSVIFGCVLALHQITFRL